MDIKYFKMWLVDNRMDDNDLFMQSLKCYQVEAYKASFQYSYLGLVDHIRQLIINYGDVPKQFAIKKSGHAGIEGLWKNTIKPLDSEDKWEEAVLNFINEGTLTNIFMLKDNIRNEFIQKKDLRNVCAHNKTRSISATTVEDLWDFIVYANPYLVINGSIDVLKERFEKIVKFTEPGKYEIEIKEIYNDYIKMQTNDRKEYFLWLLNFIEEAISSYDYGILECLDVLFEYIFDKAEVEEYQWINDLEIEIYCYLNINNYRKIFDTKKLQEFAYDNINRFLGMLIPLGNDNKNCNMLQLIYSEKNFQSWWNILTSISNSQYTFVVSESLADLIVSTGKLGDVFERFEDGLYSYTTGYGNKYTTDTFDYTSFQYYRGEIKIILLLAKENKINGSDTDKLLEHCKNLLGLDYSNDTIKGNYGNMYSYLERDTDLFEWLKSKLK